MNVLLAQQQTRPLRPIFTALVTEQVPPPISTSGTICTSRANINNQIHPYQGCLNSTPESQGCMKFMRTFTASYCMNIRCCIILSSILHISFCSFLQLAYALYLLVTIPSYLCTTYKSLLSLFSVHTISSCSFLPLFYISLFSLSSVLQLSVPSFFCSS